MKRIKKVNAIKRFVLTALIFSALTQINAQDHKLELGLNGGFGISTVFGSTYPYDYGGSLGVNNSFAVGLIFQVNFNDVFSLAVNPMYDKKGVKRKDINLRDSQGNPIGPFDQYTNLSYLTLPILARFSFGDKSAKFVLGVGPYVSRLLSAKTKLVEGGNINEPFGEQTDVSGIYNGFDFGPTLGLGFASQLNDFLILEAEIRTAISFVQIIDDNSSSSGPLEYFVDGSRNFSANFLLGLKYILPD